jgi:ABC-type dipeptide/oligopeptide/nickel transport system permease subunit
MSVGVSPPQELFRPRPARPVDRPARTPVAWRQDAVRRLRRHRLALVGFWLVVGLSLLAVVGPRLVPFAYDEQNLLEANEPPSLRHWFGTDDFGRDVFARVWVGARISLFVGLTAALLDLIIGVLFGGISGYVGGVTDDVMMRAVDLLYGVPHLLSTILFMVVLGPGLFTIIVAMVATGWLGMARLVRGQILQLKELEFVQASVALGTPFARILFRHLVPNAMGPILVNVTLTVPAAIFTEATLSFLGLGVPIPLASWGTMTAEGLVTILSGEIWRLAFPAAFISLTMFGFNAFGDGLRDALDPRLKR